MGPTKRETPHGETAYSPTSLLRALTANPYGVDSLRDQGTQREPAPPDTPVTRTTSLLLAILLGFAVAAAVVSLRADAVSDDSPRALLAQEVRDATAAAEALEVRQDELEGEVVAAQEEVLGDGDSEAARRLADFEASGLTTALSGPGLTLTVDDSAPLAEASGITEGPVNRVTDEDLQIVVNGLWAAGAEAISVNGQRLTATSAIRTAGSAILVDLRPVSPPYEVVALGDPGTLRSGFDASAAGEYLTEISTRFAIRTSWETGEELTVPARTIGTLREASAIESAPE
ncbi:MAG TPA: DUF881 domain-containing protein [Candidatus Brachybacterium merdigallinarum]|nr:DUF881 domain-containing protein [Candidatus Brachybacterium merdigallinarum]